jgi:peptidoglycan/xylan/chitin deacetylase (PgdA/CDA1 family)
MPFLTDQGLRADVRGAETAIREVLGVEPAPWFRLPFGHGEDDPRILSALDELGYRHVGWDVDGMDWDPSRSVEDLERSVIDGAVAHGDGAIVLLHTWSGTTSLALPRIVEGLRAAGAELVRLTDLPALSP